jgi:hypothetical protein
VLVMNFVRGLAEIAREAVPAGVWSGIAGASGAILQMPPWLIGLGQAVIVVAFVLRGLDKRLAKINELDAKVTSLTVRVDALERATPAPLKLVP